MFFVENHFNRFKPLFLFVCLFRQSTTFDYNSRDGFLYLSTNKNIQFRKPGDLTRDIKQIAPEELASGLKKIIELNITVDKKGLYQFLATQCGISRITQGIHDIFDEVLILLSDYILVKGDLVSLKK